MESDAEENFRGSSTHPTHNLAGRVIRFVETQQELGRVV